MGATACEVIGAVGLAYRAAKNVQTLDHRFERVTRTKWRQLGYRGWIRDGFARAAVSALKRGSLGGHHGIRAIQGVDVGAGIGDGDSGGGGGAGGRRGE